MQCEYDAARRLCTLTNENGARYTFVYDAAGHLIEEEGFDGRVSEYLYDASGLASEVLQHGAPVADGVPGDTLHTRLERDEMGRVISATTERAHDKRVERASYRYDPAGWLIEAANGCCRVERGYDELGNW